MLNLFGECFNGFLQGDDSNKKQIEKQVLKLWDTMYNSWLSKVSRVISFDDWNLVIRDLYEIITIIIEYSYILRNVSLYTGSKIVKGKSVVKQIRL